MNVSKDKFVMRNKICAIGDVPKAPVAAQLRYILSAHLFAILATALFGIAVCPPVPEVSIGIAAMRMLLITGTGWAIHTLVAAVLIPRRFVPYHVAIASIMWRGVLPLFPVILLAVWSFHSATLTALCVAASSTWMISQHIHHARVLQLSQWWTVLWFTLLVSGALFWLFIFWSIL